MQRYIGLDGHSESCTLAIINHKGKRLSSAVVETNGRALTEVIAQAPQAYPTSTPVNSPDTACPTTAISCSTPLEGVDS